MDASEWDRSRTVVDHVDLHVADLAESVRFYETVLEPLGIPKLYERDDEACFTRVNVVVRIPPTRGLGPARATCRSGRSARCGTDPACK
jgi:hypothetical protein